MPRTDTVPAHDALAVFQPLLRAWFAQVFAAPTEAQQRAWPAIARGEHTLLLAPTGSGKTLAAFMVAIDRLMLRNMGTADPGVRVLYISPLKALGVDVERNLRTPLAGVQALAQREGLSAHTPTVGVRSGDTPATERARLRRAPPDILITTPESLYLLLTSQGREALRHVGTVIVDEIHALIGGKRGAHLAVSLERLEVLRREHDRQRPTAQRIGLSATQRPLEEVARLLGGAEIGAGRDAVPVPRPVTIIDAGITRRLELRVEMPAEESARAGNDTAIPNPLTLSLSPAHAGERRSKRAALDRDALPSGPKAGAPMRPSIWPSIHPRLIDLIRAHRSTMIFVNSRRLSERLAAALNELAGEELALAHHGSLAKDRRTAIEDQLKRGELRAIIATSSLELGVDMGAVDLVIQIEAPPSIAAGLQRVGRAGHHVGGLASGVLFPKYRGDLLACAAATHSMQAGSVEAMHYPRNPLDVLAQQIVAMVALAPLSVDRLYDTVRGAAPFFDLPRAAFENVLDLLSGRYPADEFAGLTPRVNWDRINGMVAPRRGAQRVAILNAGTIPDRGLYGVFLADDGGNGASRRVGELDEEMVFESRPGDVFLLGASSWRIVEITHDRVLVVPAPGEPGKMPFWRGDGLGRPLEFGRAIGRLARELVAARRPSALKRLTEEHGLEARAASNLIEYLAEQRDVTGEVPSDRTLIVERFIDEVGDWRVAILSPHGARVHAPWAIAVSASLRQRSGGEVDLMWSDDGIVFRMPEADTPPDPGELFPPPGDIETMLLRELSQTALFAAHFRENAARALLLPRRAPDRRTPLWVQRRRAADLLNVAARYDTFPIVLETYRECLREVFDVPGLCALLQEVATRAIEVRVVDAASPSPFAASLLFNYVGNFIYDGDAPLAERRAQMLALDRKQLRELLGDAEMRELIDAPTLESLALSLQSLGGPHPARHIDDVHTLLLRLGDLSREELAARTDTRCVSDGSLQSWIDELLITSRIIEVRMAGEHRYIAAEDAGRMRDALGVAPPVGLPAAFLEPVRDPLGDLVSRYARTHVPFQAEDVAARLGTGVAPVRAALKSLAARDRVVEGEFTPGGRDREWCDTEVLRTLKRRSLAHLRKQVEPVETQALARFLPRWQGITHPRRGLDGLLDVIAQLQGAALPASVLEKHILRARMHDFEPGDLDALCAAGEVVWQGIGSLGEHDGRIALYLTDHVPSLMRMQVPATGELQERIRKLLRIHGALFFDDITDALGAFPNDVLKALWDLVWCGEVSNDTLAPLRSLARIRTPHQRSARRGFRSRRLRGPAGSEGRWTLLIRGNRTIPGSTERQTALAKQLLERYGVLTRDMVIAESVSGGYAGLYPVLKAMEEAGRARRGYFVAGRGAAQFALPGAEDRLRQRENDNTEMVVLSACDPANAYGAALPWPERTAEGASPQRVAGARVILHDGALLAYLGRRSESLLTYLPSEEQTRVTARRDLAKALAGLAADGQLVLIVRIDQRPASEAELAEDLIATGFRPTLRGLQFPVKREPRGQRNTRGAVDIDDTDSTTP